MLVLKFGGASLASPKHFLRVADLIIEKAEQGNRLVVVVSAMANTTDQLHTLARQVHPNPPRREVDMMISAGERISIALLAMALAAKGKGAVSFTGSQSGIMTNSDHECAKILEVRPKRVLEALALGKIVIVAGFQGVSLQGEITTIGRGGSDITAIALAGALGADRVEFFKDVPGIFSADPKKFPEAEKYVELSYEEALVLALKGAKVLHPRCITLAANNGIQLLIRSFKSDEEGTWIGKGVLRKNLVVYEGESAC